MSPVPDLPFTDVESVVFQLGESGMNSLNASLPRPGPGRVPN